MLKERYPQETFDERDFKPFVFPSQRDLNKNKIKALYLGNYIPWDVKQQVKIIKKNLGWQGDNVEGIPPEYNYEKIECLLQGSRDYTKFLKRGFGRTSHLTSIDIRNERKSRKDALELVRKYDGKKPKSLDILLEILNLSEKEYHKIIEKHVVFPNKMPANIIRESRNIFYKEFQNAINKFKN